MRESNLISLIRPRDGIPGISSGGVFWADEKMALVGGPGSIGDMSGDFSDHNLQLVSISDGSVIWTREVSLNPNIRFPGARSNGLCIRVPKDSGFFFFLLVLFVVFYFFSFRCDCCCFYCSFENG